MQNERSSSMQAKTIMSLLFVSIDNSMCNIGNQYVQTYDKIAADRKDVPIKTVLYVVFHTHTNLNLPWRPYQHNHLSGMKFLSLVSDLKSDSF